MSANSRQTFTVKKVAKLSGVSIRTLRFYDEIGLLKPAFYGENGYRYYGKEQLLILQQVLFYRELGFELAMIQKIVADPKFDKAAALRSHRTHLLKETERTNALIGTIDKTLAHLERRVPMKDDEMYLGFDPKKQAEYEQQAIDRWGEPAREHIAESKRRTKDWKKEDFDRVKRDYDDLHRAFAAAIDRGLTPECQEVQALVTRHCTVVNRFWTPNRASYIGLGRTYCEHPDFRKQYAGYHLGLAEYLAEAMKVYAERELN
jgi:DNA-binding transcriptional MerR regulator